MSPAPTRAGSVVQVGTRTERRIMATEDAVSYYRERLIEEIELGSLAGLTADQRRARVERVVGRLVSREGPMLSSTDRGALIRWVVDESVGLGVLEPLLADHTVTEIMVNGADSIWVERQGRLEVTDARFSNVEQLLQTIDRIVSRVNRRVDESSPMVDARLPTGERVNVIIPPLSLRGPAMTIRRFPRTFTLARLVAGGAMDEVTAQFLATCVRSRLNLVISGGTGAGKTTLLNAMSAFIPERERVITIEDNAELQLQRAHVLPLEARPANVEGRGQVTIRDLVRNSLRMRPDRIIVGEVRGPETLDMLQAMNTGHEGSLVTVHSNTAEDALHRLGTLATMSELDIPYEALREQINSAIHMVAHVDRYPDGSRKLTEVGVVTSARRDPLTLSPIMRYEPDVMRAGQPVTGSVRYFRLPSTLEDKLRLSSEEIPPEFVHGGVARAASGGGSR